MENSITMTLSQWMHVSAGTTASMCGIETALREDNAEKLEEAVRMDVMLHAYMLVQSGIPMLYSGDEIAQLNDNHYKENPQKQKTHAIFIEEHFCGKMQKKKKKNEKRIFSGRNCV